MGFQFIHFGILMLKYIGQCSDIFSFNLYCWRIWDVPRLLYCQTILLFLFSCRIKSKFFFPNYKNLRSIWYKTDMLCQCLNQKTSRHFKKNVTCCVSDLGSVSYKKCVSLVLKRISSWEHFRSKQIAYRLCCLANQQQTIFSFIFYWCSVNTR